MKGIWMILFITAVLTAETPSGDKPEADKNSDDKPEADKSSDDEQKGKKEKKKEFTLPEVCNPLLLETFKLNSSKVPEDHPNLACPGITHNCCSYAAQHQINRLWAKGSERETIVDLYRGFVDAYREIFAQFTRIEPMAQKIFAATEEQLDSPCNMLAKAVIDAKFSALKDEVLIAAKRAFNFLYDSRKGFYCSLCDKKAHHLFQPEGELVALSYSFCGDMVKETLPFYLFKHVHFMKMARLYGELMAKCTIEGEYSPNEYLNSNALFLREPEFDDELTTCKANLEKPDAFDYCDRFCERFNPVRFDPLLEGDLSKLASFTKVLKTLADSKLGIVKVSSKDGLLNITEKSGRLLAERDLSESRGSPRKLKQKNKGEENGDKKTKKTQSDDEEDEGAPSTGLQSKAEINVFNKKHSTVLLRPVTYDFQYDLEARFRVSFDYSYISSAHDSRYKVSKWIGKLMKEGINFYYYGRSSDFTKKTANKVFLAANPKPVIDISGDGESTKDTKKDKDGDDKKSEDKQAETQDSTSNSKDEDSPAKK